MVGINMNDSTFEEALAFGFTFPRINMPIAEITMALWFPLNATQLKSVVAEYKDYFFSFHSNFTAAAQVRTDAFYALDSWNLAMNTSAHGVPTYFYVLDHVLSYTPEWIPPEQIGCSHTFELPFIFGIPCFFSCTVLNSTFSDEELSLVREMQSNWVNFAREGQPNSQWPAFTNSSSSVQILSLQSRVVSNFHELWKVDFWNDFGYLFQ